MSLENVRNIVLVLSGKGGVGKSSVTTQLALSLNLTGKSVGVLDIDLTGPSIPRLLGLDNAKIVQVPGGWQPVQVHSRQTLSPLSDDHQVVFQAETQDGRSSGFLTEETEAHQDISYGQRREVEIGSLHAISLAFLLPSASSAVIWRGPKKTAMIRQFLTDVLWPPIDYLLIDTPPGTSDEHISLVETLLQKASLSSTTTETQTASQSTGPHHDIPRLAGAVVVTTPQAVAVADVKKELNFCQKVGIPVLGIIENMSGYICECCGETTNLFGRGGGEVMAQEFGHRFLGRAPLDQGWGKVIEERGWANYERVTNDRGHQEQEQSQIQEQEKQDNEADHPIAQSESNVSSQSSALLVDRYRSCRLSLVYAQIVRQLAEIVEA